MLFGLNVLSFFTSKAGVLTLIGALVLGVIGVQALRLKMTAHELSDLKAANKAAAAEVAARSVKASAISEHVAADVSSSRKAVAERIAPLVKRVREEVPEGADRACTVPTGFVNLWNSAVQP